MPRRPRYPVERYPDGLDYRTPHSSDAELYWAGKGGNFKALGTIDRMQGLAELEARPIAFPGSRPARHCFEY